MHKNQTNLEKETLKESRDELDSLKLESNAKRRKMYELSTNADQFLANLDTVSHSIV